MDRQTAVNWDGGFWAEEDSNESEGRRGGNAESVSQTSQHGMMIGSAGGAPSPPQAPWENQRGEANLTKSHCMGS